MKELPIITLKRIRHRKDNQISLQFDYNKDLKEIIGVKGIDLIYSHFGLSHLFLKIEEELTPHLKELKVFLKNRILLCTMRVISLEN